MKICCYPKWIQSLYMCYPKWAHINQVGVLAGAVHDGIVITVKALQFPINISYPADISFYMLSHRLPLLLFQCQQQCHLEFSACFYRMHAAFCEMEILACLDRMIFAFISDNALTIQSEDQRFTRRSVL